MHDIPVRAAAVDESLVHLYLVVADIEGDDINTQGDRAPPAGGITNHQPTNQRRTR
jgi:hypothetical protein